MSPEPPRRSLRARLRSPGPGWAGVLAIGFALVLVAAFLVLRSAPGTPGPAHAGATHAMAKKRTTAPIVLVSTVPRDGAASVPADGVLEVRLSAPLGAGSPLPRLTPSIPGTWELLDAATLGFAPSSPWVPGTHYALTVPGGQRGLRAADGARLAATTVVRFRVQPGSVRSLQELLATLGYLPVTWRPALARVQLASMNGLPVGAGGTAQSGASAGTALVAGDITAAVEPAAGSFAWRYPNTPAELRALWQPGGYGVETRGAVMQFESVVGLPTDGVPGPGLWAALLHAVARRAMNPQGYSWADVSESLPESLTIWHNGARVFHSLANTGIPAAPTALGTYPIYARYVVTTMSGYNPDGSYYSDPGIPWTNYFNGGDAIHGFIRPGYGYPQSLGCVELPFAAAAAAWHWLHYGTLVTVA